MEPRPWQQRLILRSLRSDVTGDLALVASWAWALFRPCEVQRHLDAAMHEYLHEEDGRSKE